MIKSQPYSANNEEHHIPKKQMLQKIYSFREENRIHVPKLSHLCDEPSEGDSTSNNSPLRAEGKLTTNSEGATNSKKN